MIQKLCKLCLFKSFGSHVGRPYDWRDDHAMNIYYQQDSRRLNVPNPDDYVYPHQADPQPWIYVFPDNYDPKNLYTNFVGPKHVGHITNALQVPNSDYLADIQHQFDYESQDLDFQPESFKTQHFRKKGPMWMWILVGALPFLYYSNEFFYQAWPDDDFWRYQRPPPTDYPNPDTTQDSFLSQLFESQGYQKYYDAGQVREPFLKMKDGKKVYSQWAGVNQPGEVI